MKCSTICCYIIPCFSVVMGYKNLPKLGQKSCSLEDRSACEHLATANDESPKRKSGFEMYKDNKESISNQKGRSNQRFSQRQRAEDLKASYIFDFEGAWRQRLEGIKKYDYQYNVSGIDRRTDLSFQEYKDVYDGKWPVIVTDIVPTWPAINWTLDSLKEKYGQAKVTVTASSGNVKQGLSMPLSKFLNNMNQSSRQDWMYLQDELFLLQRPELRAQILDHVYSSDNLFEAFPEGVRPWDSFFLLGPAFSRSSLHIDPYNWTGTSAILFGQKKWKLLPPGQDNLLHIPRGAMCGFPLECYKYNSPLDLFDSSVPGLQYIPATCYPGDLLIIPTGWFHQAYNEAPTLAISGQIMNSNNYIVVLEEILKMGHIPRDKLPQDLDRLSPEQSVELVMSLVPEEVLQQGAINTEMYLHGINDGHT